MKKQRKTGPKSSKPLRRFYVHNIHLRRLQIFLIGLSVLAIVFTASSYGLAFWYTQKHKNQPLVYGTTFVAGYARYFGLDPKETMQAMIDEVGFRQFRLVSYWDEIEKIPALTILATSTGNSAKPRPPTPR